MLAVVTGASGLLGGNLAVELLGRGHRVRATQRASTRIGHLEGRAIEWISADLDDREGLTDAFRNADVVFHCAAAVSILKTVTPPLQRANVDGTRNVLAAVREANVPRLVHCSTVGAVGLSPDGQPSNEDAAWNFAERRMADGYVTTKRRAEEAVLAAVREDGLDAVIANPTYLLGPLDARPSSGKLIVDVVRRKVPGKTPGKNNFVDVRDVARGMIALSEKGRTGERYILGGENLSYAEVIELVARVAGVRPPRWNLPRAVTAPLGYWGDLLEVFGREPLVNSVTVGYAYCKDFVFTSDKARREIGYTTGPLETAVRDAIEWFRQAGMLP